MADSGDSGIEQETNPGADGRRAAACAKVAVSRLSTERSSPEEQDKRSEKSSMDDVQEDMTRQMLTLMDVDSVSETPIVGSLVNHVPTIATSRPASMGVDSDAFIARENCC